MTKKKKNPTDAHKESRAKKKKKVRTMKICKTCVRPPELATEKRGICKIYYLWVTVITPDICQILQEKPNRKLKMVLFRMNN